MSVGSDREPTAKETDRDDLDLKCRRLVGIFYFRLMKRINPDHSHAGLAMCIFCTLPQRLRTGHGVI